MLCQITSEAKRDGLEIPFQAMDFTHGSLPIYSHIRPNKIFTTHRRIIRYVAGRIDDRKYGEVAQRIVELVR